MLFKYLQQVQRLARDQRQEFLNVDDLIDYVNAARREVSNRSHCVRILPPISGSISSVSITAGGSGYTASPTVTFSTPGFPSGLPTNPNGVTATLGVTVAGGVITATTITQHGAGYFEPIITITDATGTGATLTPTVGGLNVLNQGQEVYNFSDVPLTNFPGIDSIIGVQSVSIIYSNYRYSLPMYSFSVYQAMIRNFPFQYQYVPSFFAQYGQGNSGSLYFYPLPSQTYQMDWDCYCQPSDLVTDLSIELIPQPWQDAVPYFAAYLAFNELQNFNAAKYYETQFNNFLIRYSNYARPGRAVNPYGRY